MGRRTYEVKLYLTCKRLPEKVLFYKEDELKEFLQSLETESMIATDTFVFRVNDVKYVKIKER